MTQETSTWWTALLDRVEAQRYDVRAAASAGVDRVRRRVQDAGGTMLDGPYDQPGLEAGPGARFHYMRAPWGTYIELLTFPNGKQYERFTDLRRWIPRRARASPD